MIKDINAGITQELVQKLFTYDPRTGYFIRNDPHRVYKSDGTVGSLGNGYLYLYINGVRYKAHRIAWLYVYGELPNRLIDHIDHDRLNNRIDNLRVVGYGDNHLNKSMSPKNTSGFNGVYWDKNRNKWTAKIHINYKFINLGRFNTFEEAVIARIAANKLYGFHENHGK